MEMSRGLLIILGLLSLGICSDAAGAWQGGSARIILIAMLVGRLAAIVGILMRTRTGWWLAVGFFGALIMLNLMVLAESGGALGVIGLIVSLGCAAYLVAQRNEFE